MRDKESFWNPSNCEFEFDKSCDVGEYLDYKDCRKSVEIKSLINYLKNVVKILTEMKCFIMKL